SRGAVGAPVLPVDRPATTTLLPLVLATRLSLPPPKITSLPLPIVRRVVLDVPPKLSGSRKPRAAVWISAFQLPRTVMLSREPEMLLPKPYRISRPEGPPRR